MQTCSGRSPIPRIVLSGQERRQRSRAQSRQIARSRRARIDRRFSHLSKSSTEPVGRRCDATRGRQATRSETRQRRREEEESIPARADSVATETVSREARPRDDERRSRFTVNPRRSLLSHRGRAERKSNSRTIMSNLILIILRTLERNSPSHSYSFSPPPLSLSLSAAGNDAFLERPGVKSHDISPSPSTSFSLSPSGSYVLRFIIRSPFSHVHRLVCSGNHPLRRSLGVFSDSVRSARSRARGPN